MTLIEDYGLDSPARSLLLTVLSIEDLDQKTEMDKLHIQKVLRYYEHLKERKDIDFSNFKLGGVSYELEENRETLMDYELIEESNSCFFLTKEGQAASQEVVKIFAPQDFQQLVWVKQLLNDLPSDELLYFMYKTIPETQKHSTEFPRLEKKKELLVKSLFAKRKIDSCTAMKWLGTNEDEFVKMFPKKKLSEKTLKLLNEGYEKCANEDSDMAKDFEAVEEELDETCDS
jgi:hypothetical protein